MHGQAECAKIDLDAVIESLRRLLRRRELRRRTEISLGFFFVLGGVRHGLAVMVKPSWASREAVRSEVVARRPTRRRREGRLAGILRAGFPRGFNSLVSSRRLRFLGDVQGCPARCMSLCGRRD